MRVFRTSYRDRDGQKRQASKWYIELRDHLQTVRRFPGFVDKSATEALGQQIKKLIECRGAGEPLNPALCRWLSQTPQTLRQRFVEIGLLDAERASGGKPLSEHLTDFEKFLIAKGNTPDHVSLVVSRARRTIEGCKFFYWMDLSASKVQRYLAGLRETTKDETGSVKKGISAQTFNFYLQALKEFCRWMVQDRRASESPVQHLKGLNVRTDRRHDRRALSPDEIRLLLETATTQPERFAMTGQERAMLYQLAVETGLRANELRTLKVSSFDFDNCSVVVEAAYSKHRRRDVLPLRPDTANKLREFFKNKLPSALAFNMPEKPAKMFKADLEAAGIAYVDESGRYADFHSLRHTTGSLLACAGVHPKVAQSIMRHSDINLTLSRYTHTLSGQETQAVESLPDLSLPSSQSQQAVKTGTDDENVLASCLARETGKHRTTSDAAGIENRIGDEKGQKIDNANVAQRQSSGFVNRRLWVRIPPLAFN